MKDGKFRHPADAAQWGNINTHFPWFDDARSIRFAMSTDGVNPFGNQSSTHITLPTVMSLYNLSPWLCKKQKYMMLIILVSRPKQPGHCIDVYLRPLVDDLKILWKPGVPEVWDEYKHQEFTMHGMLFTTINDNPAHRNLQRNTYLWGTVVSLARNIHTEPWIVSLMGKRRIERRHCM
jgi:hypothetical protein